MKLKTLLLGTAAAVMVAGGAQAADLSVAEPVDYVKVCDAFGAGYWYIPGSDTCLKIGGYVRFDVNFHEDAVNQASHTAAWDFNTKSSVTFTAKSMTEYGPLSAFVDLQAVTNNTDGANYLTGDSVVYLDNAYLELGMLLAGRTGSIYNQDGGFTWDWNDYDADATTDQVRLTWAMSGFGIQLAIEDPRDRWGLANAGDYGMPDIVGAITFGQGNWSAELDGGYADTIAGSGFGAQIGATLKLDAIAPGDALLLKAAWAQNEVSNFAYEDAPVFAGGSIWSAAAAFKHFWSPTLSSAVNFQYYDQTDGTSGYLVGANLVWSPVTNFFAGVEAGYYSEISDASPAIDGTWAAKIRLQRSW